MVSVIDMGSKQAKIKISPVVYDNGAERILKVVGAPPVTNVGRT